MIYDILIVGGGPAGLTAAIYGRRSGKSVLLVEKEGFGGQIALSPRVENYPGEPSVSGAELADRMLSQAIEQGTDTEVGTVERLEQKENIWCALTDDGECYEARSVILAVGAEHRRLGLEKEDRLLGKGISYCAVCDGEFYRDKPVCVCGGGDSALQETLLLSELCSHVTLIHRRNEFRGEHTLLERLKQRKNVSILTPYNVKTLLSDKDKLSGLALSRADNGEEREIPCECLFVCYGQTPATAPFRDILALEGGYAAAGEDCVCGRPGLFVAGDCRRKSVRQLTTAVADGANAALSAVHYLEA